MEAIYISLFVQVQGQPFKASHGFRKLYLVFTFVDTTCSEKIIDPMGGTFLAQQNYTSQTHYQL